MAASRPGLNRARRSKARQYAYRTFQDFQGRKVRLSMARWRHIMRRHPDVTEDALRDALAAPDRVEGGLVNRVYSRQSMTGTLVVALRDSRGLYLRTACIVPL